MLDECRFSAYSGGVRKVVREEHSVAYGADLVWEHVPQFCTS